MVARRSRLRKVHVLEGIETGRWSMCRSTDILRMEEEINEEVGDIEKYVGINVR